MKFITHRNFPEYAAKLLTTFVEIEAPDAEIRLFRVEHAEETADSVWLDCKRHSRDTHESRIIVAFNDGVRINELFKKSLRDARCSFVYLAVGWSKMHWADVAWRLVKCWPEVLNTVRKAIDAGKRCMIEVSVKGKCRVENL